MCTGPTKLTAIDFHPTAIVLPSSSSNFIKKIVGCVMYEQVTCPFIRHLVAAVFMVFVGVVPVSLFIALEEVDNFFVEYLSVGDGFLYPEPVERGFTSEALFVAGVLKVGT